jgi:hypothetical protein
MFPLRMFLSQLPLTITFRIPFKEKRNTHFEESCEMDSSLHSSSPARETSEILPVIRSLSDFLNRFNVDRVISHVHRPCHLYFFAFVRAGLLRII